MQCVGGAEIMTWPKLWTTSPIGTLCDLCLISYSDGLQQGQPAEPDHLALTRASDGPNACEVHAATRGISIACASTGCCWTTLGPLAGECYVTISVRRLSNCVTNGTLRTVVLASLASAHQPGRASEWLSQVYT